MLRHICIAFEACEIHHCCDCYSSTQFTKGKPAMRWNSLWLLVTTVAPSARAWQAIQRSLAPMGPVQLAYIGKTSAECLPWMRYSRCRRRGSW